MRPGNSAQGDIAPEYGRESSDDKSYGVVLREVVFGVIGHGHETEAVVSESGRTDGLSPVVAEPESVGKAWLKPFICFVSAIVFVFVSNPVHGLCLADAPGAAFQFVDTGVTQLPGVLEKEGETGQKANHGWKSDGCGDSHRKPCRVVMRAEKSDTGHEEKSDTGHGEKVDTGHEEK